MYKRVYIFFNKTKGKEIIMSQEINVKATIKEKNEKGEVTSETSVTGSCTYDFGETLDDAVALFGAEVVMNNFKQNAVISAQSRMRALLVQGLEGDALQEKLDEWKPGVKTSTRKSPVDKLKDLLAGRSPEEIAALIAEAGIGEEEAA